MNLIKRSLTLLVVMAFTSQALLPDFAHASATAPVVDQAEDMEDTEEEEEEAQTQSSEYAFYPYYIIPVVVTAALIVASVWHFRRNVGAALPLLGAGTLHQGGRPATPALGQDEGRGSNAVQTDATLAAAVETLVATPGQTPMRQRVAVAQVEVVAVAPVHTGTRVEKKVVFVDENSVEVHTPELPPPSSKKVRTDTPIPTRQAQAPAQPSPFRAVLDFVTSPFRTQAAPAPQAANEVQPMDIDPPVVVAPAVNEFDEEEEEDVARARKGKKKGAATAIKRGRRKTAEERAAEEAAPLTASLAQKRARRTAVNYQDE